MRLRRDRTMVNISCPWCEEDQPLSLTELAAREMSFTCPECGTTVAIATELESALDPAA